MHEIQLREAKATLSAVVDQARQGQPSVITVAEVEDGIARSRRRTGTHAKAKRLTHWLDTLLHLYSDRLLPIDIPTACKSVCWRTSHEVADTIRDWPTSPSQRLRRSTITKF